MPTQLSTLQREQADLLALVDEILRLDWEAVGPGRAARAREGMLVEYIRSGGRLDEVIIALPDHERVYLSALRDHFGSDTEIATCRRRVHRWVTGAHEVLLDSCCDGGCHLIVD